MSSPTYQESDGEYPLPPIDDLGRRGAISGPRPRSASNPVPQLGLLSLETANNAPTPKEKDPEPREASKQPLKLLLCRFKDGKLEKAVKSPESTEFLAISHVWGKAEWRKIAGIEDEIRVSLEKAKFISEQLPSIVGDQWFWMDVLCINQRDDQARVAITQHIPSVFRLAQKTIAVRDSTGFKECCAQAIGNIRYFFSKSREWRSKNEDESHIDFSDHPDGRHLLIEHLIDEHAGDVMDEGLLTRLWPLQEIILSNTIQFVRCEPVESGEKQKPRVTTEHEKRKISAIGSSLSSLALTWSTHGEANDNPWRHRIGFTKNDLVSAFLNLGTASRRQRNIEVMLPNERDIMMHLNSTRETSKPRDFILAIMPQYGFYNAPQNAKQLSFTELFVDCCRQLREVDSGLSPLFMESDHILDGRVGQLSIDVPEPKCLGDLVKLFGGPFLRCPKRSVVDLQIVKAELMTEVMKRAADLLPSAEEMRKHSSRDRAKMLLSRKGRASESTGDYLKLTEDVVVIHNIVRSIFSSTILWPISQHEMDHELTALPEEAREKRQAIEALYMILSRIDLEKNSYENAVRMTNYPDIQALLKPIPWEIPIMLAAMISCGLGISGLDWAVENLSALQLVMNEVSYLALAPKSTALREEVMYVFKEGGDFHGGRDGPMPRQALLTGNPDAKGFFVLCMFPPDTKFKASRWY